MANKYPPLMHPLVDVKTGRVTAGPWAQFFQGAAAAEVVPVDSTPTQYDAGDSGAAKTIDWTNGDAQLLRLTADTVITFTGGVAGGSYVLRLATAPGGPYTVTWPASVVWDGDVEPGLSAGVSGLDLVAWYFDGTTYLGAGANASALTQGLPEVPLAVRHGGTGQFSVSKGDLLVGVAGGTLSKLPVSTAAGTVLTANPAVAGGMEWQAGSDAARVACSVYLSTNFVANTGVLYPIEWDTEDFDVAGMHDNGAPTLITVPTAGLYQVTAGMQWSGQLDEFMYIDINRNGSLRARSIGIGGYGRSPAWIFSLAAGDTLSVTLHHDAGVARTVYGGSYSTFCQVLQVK